jgi:hypothetical protein
MFALSLESWTPKEATIRIQQQDSLKLYCGGATHDQETLKLCDESLCFAEFQQS